MFRLSKYHFCALNISKQFPGLYNHYRASNHAYQVYSDAFEQGALTQGIGLVSIFKDTTEDPISGDITVTDSAVLAWADRKL